MTMSPELVVLLTDREIDNAIDRLTAARAGVPSANIDADITLLQGERAWRERMRRKYARDD